MGPICWRKKKDRSLLVLEEEFNVAIYNGHQYSYAKLLYIHAYIIRIVERIKLANKGFSKPLMVVELQLDLLKLVEIWKNKAILYENNLLPSNMQMLNPSKQKFKDGFRRFLLLRIGGHLLNAPSKYNVKSFRLLSEESHCNMNPLPEPRH